MSKARPCAGRLKAIQGHIIKSLGTRLVCPQIPKLCPTPGPVQDGLKRVKANIASRVKKGGLPQKAADAALSKLKGTLSYDDFKSVDLVSP